MPKPVEPAELVLAIANLTDRGTAQASTQDSPGG
jgi:hypothetical protein